MALLFSKWHIPRIGNKSQAKKLVPEIMKPVSFYLKKEMLKLLVQNAPAPGAGQTATVSKSRVHGTVMPACQGNPTGTGCLPTTPMTQDGKNLLPCISMKLLSSPQPKDLTQPWQVILLFLIQHFLMGTKYQGIPSIYLLAQTFLIASQQLLHFFRDRQHLVLWLKQVRCRNAEYELRQY